MAILYGTSENDNLIGTFEEDVLIGSSGDDTLDGSDGDDIADYSSLGEAITILPQGFVNKGTQGTDQLLNIARIIGAAGQDNAINASTATESTSIDVNLAENWLTANNIPGIGSLTFTVENFVNVTGTANSDSMIGNTANNFLNGGEGDDTLGSSYGDDTLDGGDGFDTVDYSSLGEAITILPQGFVNKGTQGTDQLLNIARIIGTAGQDNAINASTATESTSIDVNLAENWLTANNIPGIGSLTFTVENFINVTGTANSDSMIGNTANNFLFGEFDNDFLVGSAGNDFLVGGNNDDILNGTNDQFRGTVELDTLQGESGVDQFILGDSLGSYYNSAGEQDFAQILDFGWDTDVITLGTGEVYDIESNPFGFDIFVVTQGVRDLVANVLTHSSGDFDLPTGDFQLASGQVLSSFIGA